MRWSLPLVVFAALSALAPSRAESQLAATPRILVFSKTAGYRHASIEPGIAAIRKLGELAEPSELPRLLDLLAGAANPAEVEAAEQAIRAVSLKAPASADCVSQVDPVLAGAAGSWADAARARDARQLFNVTYPWNFSDSWIQANPQALQASAGKYEQLDFDSLLELLDCFQRFNVTAELPKIHAPTLVMVGEEDILKPRKYAEIIAGAIPGGRLAVVPGSGHALCLEKPDVFNALVLGFIQQIVR